MEPLRSLPIDAADSDTKDPDFEEWYRTRGYRMFGTGKNQAQQWYEQRKRQAKPGVASADDPAAVLQDLMMKAMRA